MKHVVYSDEPTDSHSQNSLQFPISSNHANILLSPFQLARFGNNKVGTGKMVRADKSFMLVVWTGKAQPRHMQIPGWATSKEPHFMAVCVLGWACIRITQ